jgi:hypothetical protein
MAAGIRGDPRPVLEKLSSSICASWPTKLFGMYSGEGNGLQRSEMLIQEIISELDTLPLAHKAWQKVQKSSFASMLPDSSKMPSNLPSFIRFVFNQSYNNEIRHYPRNIEWDKWRYSCQHFAFEGNFVMRIAEFSMILESLAMDILFLLRLFYYLTDPQSKTFLSVTGQAHTKTYMRVLNYLGLDTVTLTNQGDEQIIPNSVLLPFYQTL